jgi:type IV pilus assembly protein PilN
MCYHENLQSTRADVVHLLDQMLRILPDGVYLKSLKQTGNKISLIGYAQSNARVSTLMRSIEDSPWLDTPTLIEIHATGVGGARLSEFLLNFNLTKQIPPEPTAVKPGGAKRSAPVSLLHGDKSMFLASYEHEGVL